MSTTSLPIIDSQLNSPTILQSKTQSSINTQRFIDDLNLHQTNETYEDENLYMEENKFQPDPPDENVMSNRNLKRKRKQKQSSFAAVTSNRQSGRLGGKRTRVI